MSQSETVTVTVERDFAVSAEKLWRALTQPHLIAEWLMANDFVPKVGHSFKLKGEWGGVLDCEVLTLEEPTKLAYRWDFPNDDPKFNLRSIVTFTLTPTDAGTHLRMDQAGFRPEQTQASGGAKFGWQKFLENLDTVVGKLD